MSSVAHDTTICYGKEKCMSTSADMCVNACPYDAIHGSGLHLSFTLSQCTGPCTEKYGNEERPCEKSCMGMHINLEGVKNSAVNVT
jgi:dissimilatory sulfite reductase (desulfoviridin) alpha/beta subunit